MRTQAQYTIYSLNDVVTSATAPSNPYKGQLWVDTSRNPPVTMVWNGSSWKEQNGTDELYSSITTLIVKESNLESSLNGLTSTVSQTTKRVQTLESDLGAVEEDILEMMNDVSFLEQTASEISAKVSKKVDETYGSSSSSFGWSLKSTGFYIYSNATTVMTVTSSGLSVTGSITAKSGSLENMVITGKLFFGGDQTYYINANYNDGSYYISLPGLKIDKASTAVFSGKLSAPSGTIGGFTISTSSIYKTKTSYSSSTSGVYIGTDGIGLGAGTFYVTSAGKLYATNAEISGKMTCSSGTIGGFTIGASSLTNTSGGSYIQITSGSYVTRLSANSIQGAYSTSDGLRGWSLSLDQFTISSYTSSKYTGIKIMPSYTRRTSSSSTSSTTVAEGCITSYKSGYYNADNGTTSWYGTPFIIGMYREYADAPYAPSKEWGAYLRFSDYNVAELVYDSAYSGKWQLRNVSGSTYNIVELLQHVYNHKFYFWKYTSSVSNDSRASITKTTHGLSTVTGAIVIPRENGLYGEGSSLSGDNNLINKRANYGIYISGTTVYVVVDTNGLPHGFFCLIFGY